MSASERGRSDARLLFRASGAVAAVIGAYLLVSGVIRLNDDGPEATLPPAARLALGVVVLLAALALLALGFSGRRRVVPEPVRDDSRSHTGSRTCASCGHQAPDDGNFCDSCGEALP